MPLPSIEEYRVGWVCALPKELTAARAMLDEEYEEFQGRGVQAQDNNTYVLGRIHQHSVVIACLPAGMYGTNSAAAVAINMMRTYPEIRLGLMVGIGGGIPNLSRGVDIRLGDVVVSQPDGIHGGVIQYDLRKNLGEGRYECKGFLRPPPSLLLTALANLQSRHQMRGNQIPEILADTIRRLPRLAQSGFMHPGLQKDALYCSNVEEHQDIATCSQCRSGIIYRSAREDQRPEVHYGVIASGNELMKNAIERDRLGREFGAKCVEMEAAGLVDFPCIVIRGICDYADSHKNDEWQEYSAITAAAFAKELLSIVKPPETTMKNVPEVVMSEYNENFLRFQMCRVANTSIEYNLGLNLFDAPDIGAGLFMGREPELQYMETVLQPPSQSNSSGTIRKVFILGGVGGIGKTQLAITYAKRHCGIYPSIFWLNASTEATLDQSFRDLALRLFSPEKVGTFQSDVIRASVLNWLCESNNSRWLLIFDNHDDPTQYNITKYFPSVAHGSIIITTRTPDDLQGEQVKMKHLNEDDGLRILATRSGRQNLQLGKTFCDNKMYC